MIEISNLKGCEQLEHYYIDENGDVYSDKSGKLVKLSPFKARNGYVTVRLLGKDGKRYGKTVHRLVAMAYLPNENNYPEVNHKNGDKNINNISNLEWTDRLGNIHHSINELGNSPLRFYKKCSLAVDGNIIKNFETIKDACKYASENFNVSFSSLYKHKEIRKPHIFIEIIESK